MANINLQRGLNQTVDVTYILAGQTDPVNLGEAGVYSASMVIRLSYADGGVQGPMIDELNTTNSRIVLIDDPPSEGPNIQLKWDTDESDALPNETTTVNGDLKITRVATSEVEHLFRLTFSLEEEIIA